MFNSEHHQKGIYKPINKGKYIGDITKIVTRSSWERMTCRWADLNPDIIKWGSEIIKIPYICPSDGKTHTYIIDFIFKYKDNTVLLVEVKPYNQTLIPKSSKGKKKNTILTEHLVFIKNKSKWIYANKYAEENGAKFVIWTEKKLKSLGIPIL